MAATSDRPDSPLKSLQQGLEILGIVVRAGRPIPAGEIAEQIGAHPSTVSRILTTLGDQGLVRRHRRQGFVPDFGVFALGAASVEGFGLVNAAWNPMHEVIAANPGLEAVLVTLWHSETLYFCRVRGDRHPLPFSSHPYPLHQSTAALRLLLDRPRAEAVAMLQESRSRRGWDNPVGAIPDSPEETLDRAAALLEHSSLVTTGWLTPDHIAGAIPVEVPGAPPFVVSLSGRQGGVDVSTLRIRLLEARHLLEAALRDLAGPYILPGG